MLGQALVCLCMYDILIFSKWKKEVSCRNWMSGGLCFRDVSGVTDGGINGAPLSQRFCVTALISDYRFRDKPIQWVITTVRQHIQHRPVKFNQ